MTQEEFNNLYRIATEKPWLASLNLKTYLKSVEITEEAPKTPQKRTGDQNAALWLYITHKIAQLNEAGLDMRAVLKPTYSLPWTKESFHDHIWIPIQKAMYGTESTRELKKVGQIDRIHETIERELGEKHGLEYVPFPHDPDKGNIRLQAMENLTKEDYPEFSKTAFDEQEPTQTD